MLLEAPTIKYKLALALSQNNQDVVREERYLNRILQGVISYLGVKTVTSLMTGIADLGFCLKSLQVQYAILYNRQLLLNYIPNIGSIIAAGTDYCG